ncbi:UbiX family flavin prenyltransferase [Parasporobacterium paucivorans]|uniref:Flavin prenyltransferase UbiX n=1 Tax=Parasporobacterium paucivorans DSM 15970 TaxID=1122934 RepID=A0A1M6E4V4_9FIRM|nr:UbiX family flavin prenyltransferase [Parasporobacterium paucivorans]SHI80564.1 4-hydroxy-3-polyprenylbenzoate decarboxylase [Parasporobacterium paucivorans DSM 15970]
MKKRLVIGISGASGLPIAVELLREIKNNPEWESHVVISKGALRTLEMESSYTEQDLLDLCGHHYNLNDIGASIASGTFQTEGMIIVPCSMKTLAGITTGYSDNLLLRAADVTIKERRKLVLVARETPLSPIHLNNMLTLSNMGAIIMPPMQTFYNKPKTIDDMIYHMVGKILGVYGISCSRFHRWDPDGLDTVK